MEIYINNKLIDNVRINMFDSETSTRYSIFEKKPYDFEQLPTVINFKIIADDNTTILDTDTNKYVKQTNENETIYEIIINK